MPVPDLQVRAAHGRGPARPGGQLAGIGEPGDVADLGHHDQRGELPDAGQRPEHLDSRVGLGAGVQFPVDPAGQDGQGVDDRQAVRDDLPRRRLQVELGQPAAARPGPVTGGPVVAVVGGDRVDPVAQLGAPAGQADPVPQQRAELADLRRGDRALRAAGPPSAAAPKMAASTLSFFSRAEAMALHRSGWNRCASKP